MASIGEIMLQNVRLAFPTLFEAERINGQGEPKFSANFLLTPDHSDVAKLKAKIKEVAQNKWEDQADAILKKLVAADRIALHDGDVKADYDGYPGNWFVSASSKVRPLVIDGARNPITEEDGIIYSGCYVNAKIDVWAQDNQHGKRVNAQLQGVQFVSDGEPFAGGGRSASPDEFTDMSGVDEGDEFGESQSDGFDDIL